MEQRLIEAAEAVSQFCRHNMNIKRDLPIRPSEMGMLIFTSQHQEPITPLNLSEFFHIAKPSVSSTIKTLIQNGYLQKTQSIGDKRSFALNITEKGSELVHSTFSEFIKTMSLLENKLGKMDYQKMIELIQRSNDILNSERTK